MWSADQAANIALIKYMGKKEGGVNQPTNASLSWTLKHLRTKVLIEPSSKDGDMWLPIKTPYPFKMSQEGKKKYINHFQRIKSHFGVKEHFVISSGNNFPADCGIASSASSFAALTEAACTAFTDLTGKNISTIEKARMSALGSGSSCRSFFDGWVLWNSDNIVPIKTQIDELLHMVVIAGEGAKKVSSSLAHQRVKKSSLFPGRVERAEARLVEFKKSATQLNWSQLFQIGWEEFWDMHVLFETSQPPFGYFVSETMYVLNSVRDFWETNGDGPLVTMDAGPNVHLLWREDQRELSLKYFNESLKEKLTCLSNIQEIGFAKI